MKHHHTVLCSKNFSSAYIRHKLMIPSLSHKLTGLLRRLLHVCGFLKQIFWSESDVADKGSKHTAILNVKCLRTTVKMY